jgi:putative methionine-R-sulfoxide reductase with GAF domain
LLIVTLKNSKVSINRYTLENKTLRIQKNIANISYDVVSSETASEIEVGIYENTKKPICVFDVESKQEIVPAYSYDRDEKNVKGKFKLNANQ